MNYIFEENQKFTQWWLWVILLSFPIISINPFEDTPIKYTNVLIGLLIPIIFFIFQLRIKVSNEGFHYQFFPFHLKLHTIMISEILKIKSVQYKPLAEYGGWGIKYGFKGKSYTVNGKKGIKIFLNNGTNILFGSQRHKDLERSIRKISKK